jgi:hypothetical protein
MADALQALSVTCNHCGAPLEVPADTRFVTCQYCGARLEIHRSGGAAYTQVLEAIDQRTRQIADDVDTIKLQNELERLDREWAAGQAQQARMNGNGRQLSPPTNWAGGAALATFGVLWVGVCLFMMVTAINEGAPTIFPLVCGGMILIFLLAVIAMISQSGRQKEARTRYESERQRLLAAIQQQQRS